MGEWNEKYILMSLKNNCLTALLPDLHAARYTEISGDGQKIVRKIIE